MKFCELSKSQNRVLYMSTLVMQNRCFQRGGYEDWGADLGSPGGPNSVLSLKTVFASLKQRLLKEDKAKLTHAKAK